MLRAQRTSKLSRYVSRLHEFGKFVEAEHIKARDRRFQTKATRRQTRMDETVMTYSGGRALPRYE